LQVIFRKRATNYRALLRKIIYADGASSGSSPPCIPLSLSQYTLTHPHYTHTLPLSLHPTHTGILNYQSVVFSLSYTHTLSLCNVLSLTHTHTLSLSPTHISPHTLHTHTHSLSFSHTHMDLQTTEALRSLSFTHARAHFVMISLSLTHALSLTLSLFSPHTYGFTNYIACD